MLDPQTRTAGPGLDVRAESLKERDRLPLAIGLDVLRRHRAAIAGAAAAGFALGLLYLLLAPSQYTAAAQLVIDTRRSHSLPAAPEAPIDPVVIESQIETIKSEKVALIVIDKLGLQDDPEFVGPGLVGRILAHLGRDEAGRQPAPAIKQQQAVNHFERALSVIEVGRSYVADIRFTSLDPVLAARVANAVADSYIDDQLEASTSNATRATAWMGQRIDELRKQADDAARAVQLYRSQNAIPPTGDANLDGAAQARLRSLEAAAESAKRSYETFQNLNRYSQTTQERAFPVTDARILSPALPPVARTSPRTGVTLLLSLLAGCGIGLMIAFGGEYLDRTIRTRQQLEGDLGIRCLGLLPLLPGRRIVPSWRRWIGKPSGWLLRLHYPSRKGIAALFGRDDGLPRAREALIAIRIAIDGFEQAQRCQVIGVTSAYGGEGKTTVALNLADSMSASGKRVLLLDADLRNSSLTQLLAPGCIALSDALAGKLDLSALPSCPHFGFHLLAEPGGKKDGKCPAEILSSIAMRDLLRQAKNSYDHVIVDLPAALDHVDVDMMAGSLDAFVLVVEWGRTTIEDLEQVLLSSRALSERLVGGVVNKVGASRTKPNVDDRARARWI